LSRSIVAGSNLGGETRRCQELLHQRPGIGLEPLLDRHAEALLRPADALSRNAAGCEPLQQHFGFAAGDLEPTRDAESELDHVFVQERHARLERAGHRHPVDLARQLSTR
jgi:hypothetical protein